ncbi:MAG: hypothetical protein HZB84_04610 [Deltaproteobacteria bacterium]|nr:hypothetical protein [Deltaproteobacteria bacterium]
MRNARTALKLSTETKLWLLISAFLLLFAFGVYNVMRPDRGPLSLVRGDVRRITPLVLVGPYPTEEEISRLKLSGVKELVSLMKPGLPFEAELVSREIKAAEKNGLSFTNYPMDFLKSGSPENINAINQAVAHVLSSQKKTYVHCYLGRHRVADFEREFRKSTGNY